MLIRLVALFVIFSSFCYAEEIKTAKHIVLIEETEEQSGFGFNKYGMNNPGTSSTTFSFMVGHTGPLPVKFFGEGVKPYLGSNTAAADKLNTFATKRKVSMISIGTAILGGVLTFAGTKKESISDDDPNSPGVYNPQTGQFEDTGTKTSLTALGVVGVVVMVGSIATGAISYGTSKSDLYKAIKIFNEGLDANNTFHIDHSDNKLFLVWQY